MTLKPAIYLPHGSGRWWARRSSLTRLEALRLIENPRTKTKKSFIRAWTRWVLSIDSPTASVNGETVNDVSRS